MSGQFSPMVAKDRRRRRVRLLVLLAVLLGVLTAAALLRPAPQTGGLRVPVVGAAPDPTGVLRGAVSAERRGDVVCYSVAAANGTAVLRFPEGWSADERLGLRDASGGVVVQPGATVTMLGAPGPVGTVPGCDERGRVWTVTSVDLRAG
ncbi:hypothetical protein [Amnibacterium setariae]|uniref:Uncharacterized protein n=1 Tax=Amnibacterium setariae TaxID=2306585 RepID=A0A3A1TUR4_9MICO|nr:hypothetical protein [Amnibacterium setariae]RIX27610.1 hypothetical protein D1781_08555 [Amnibacterium setariae]